MTINNETDLFEVCHRNGYNLNPLTRIYERASLVPAAAVIPALMAYIVIAAVKKLVVGFVPLDAVLLVSNRTPWFVSVFRRGSAASVAGVITLNKSKCSRQAFRLYVSAWNNGIGLRFILLVLGSK